MASFCSVFLYANKCGKRAESLSDCLSLQDELDAIYNWSLISHLSFNSGKSSLMSFCSSNCSPFDFPCTINGQGVLRYKTVRELDVIFSSSLSWSDHINAIVHKGYSTLHLLHRAFSSTTPVKAK